MKLRLRNNSVRFRLTQSEVQSLTEGRSVEGSTAFGPANRLVYRISPGTPPLRAALEGSTIIVTLPAADIAPWADSNTLALEGDQQWTGGSLALSIEKDLACTRGRPGEEDADTYPNPGQNFLAG